MAVAVALWSIEVAPGEPIEVSPQADLRITNVALSDELADANGRTSLKLIYQSPGAVSEDEGEEEDEDEDGEPKLITTVLTSLTPGKIEHSTIDLLFSVDEPFLLQAVGKNTLHVTGNYVDQAGADFPPSDDEDEDDYDLDEVSSDVEVDPAELDVPSEEDEDAERFEEITAVETAVSKKRGAEALDASMDVEGGDSLSKAQKKKLAKKQKGADGTAVTVVQTEATATVTPAATESKKDKKTKGKEDPSQTAKDAKSGGEKELPGGLKIRDATTGTGKTAKNGNTVSVRYIGKLTNGKIFDKNTKGKPFSFTLGAGEVIKGWDQGIAGMAIGGERVLTVPAALGYGKRGSGKEIPPNSTLIFEVKLLEIK